MGSEELAANLFRITQTEVKLKRDDVGGKLIRYILILAKKLEILLRDLVELCLRICQHLKSL